MKKYFLNKTAIVLLTLVGLTACIDNDSDKIEFVVKSNFEIDAKVHTLSNNASFVDTFEVNDAVIDLSENIDNIGDISSILITAVSIELRDYQPITISSFGFDTYHTEDLTGNLTVSLLSNNNNKQLFSGFVNFGTNAKKRISGGLFFTDYVDVEPITLQITPTEATTLIENGKIKLKISLTNGDIRKEDFILHLVVKAEAITSI